MNPSVKGMVEGAWMPTVVFAERTGVSRDNLLDAFRRAGIDGRPFFWPLRSLPMFAEAGRPGLVASSIASRAINLPSYHDITQDEMDTVIATARGEL